MMIQSRRAGVFVAILLEDEGPTGILKKAREEKKLTRSPPEQRSH